MKRTLIGLTGALALVHVVGMGTAFAGVVRTPLTSVIMIFEVTRDYSIIVPLMGDVTIRCVGTTPL